MIALKRDDALLYKQYIMSQDNIDNVEDQLKIFFGKCGNPILCPRKELKDHEYNSIKKVDIRLLLISFFTINSIKTRLLLNLHTHTRKTTVFNYLPIYLTTMIVMYI